VDRYSGKQLALKRDLGKYYVRKVYTTLLIYPTHTSSPPPPPPDCFFRFVWSVLDGIWVCEVIFFALFFCEAGLWYFFVFGEF